MHHILRDHIPRICFIFMNHVTIYFSNFEQHLKDIKVAQVKVKRSNFRSETMTVEFFEY